MLFITVNNGTGYQIVNPSIPAHRDLLNQASRVTVTVYGADKAPILRDLAAKMAHFSYAMGGFTVETSEITARQEFSATINDCPIGAGYYLGLLLARRLMGGQTSIKQASELTVYPQRSYIRRQFLHQFAPAACFRGSDLRNASQDALMDNDGYADLIAPLFAMFNLHAHGSIAIPVTA